MRQSLEVLAVVLVGLISWVSHVSPFSRVLGGPARGCKRTYGRPQ